MRCIMLSAALTLLASSWVQGANLLSNPSFENPVLTGGDVPGAVDWTTFNAVYTIRLAPQDGFNAMKTFGAVSGAFQEFAAAPGQSWKGSVYALNPSFDALSGGQVAAVNIEWRDAGNNLISFETTPLLNASSPTGDKPSDYIYGEVMGVAPAGTSAARLVLITGAFTAAGGGAPFFDNASFEMVPEPATGGLAAAGLLMVLSRRRRRQ